MKKEKAVPTFAGLRLPKPTPVTRRAFALAFGAQPEEMFGQPIHPLAEANLAAQIRAEQRAAHEAN